MCVEPNGIIVLFLYSLILKVALRFPLFVVIEHQYASDKIK